MQSRGVGRAARVELSIMAELSGTDAITDRTVRGVRLARRGGPRQSRGKIRGMTESSVNTREIKTIENNRLLIASRSHAAIPAAGEGPGIIIHTFFAHHFIADRNEILSLDHYRSVQLSKYWRCWGPENLGVDHAESQGGVHSGYGAV